MNERYLFRGKRVDTGEWVYGHFFETVEGIRRCYNIVVDRQIKYYCECNTITQFTGLTDHSGGKIFEGDHFGSPSLSVYFSNGMFLLAGLPLKGYLNGEYMDQVSKVIGNIHDK